MSTMPKWKREQYVDALKAEREGYVARGLKDRVADVDAELSRMGETVDDKPEPKVAQPK